MFFTLLIQIYPSSVINTKTTYHNGDLTQWRLAALGPGRLSIFTSLPHIYSLSILYTLTSISVYSDIAVPRI